MIEVRRHRVVSLFAAALFFAATVAGASEEIARRAITFADLPELKEPSVSVLDWSRDSKAVFLGYKAAGTATLELLKIDVASGAQRSLGTFSGTGIALSFAQGLPGFSLSPAQDSFVYFDAGEWRLADLPSGQSRVLFKSPGFQFIPTPPSWSRDGRYVAIVELVEPIGMPRLDPATVEESNGVRVIDVGAAADAFVTKLGSSSVTVVDVRAGTTAYKMDSSPRILDAGWGEGDRLYFSSVDHGNLAEIRSFITEVKISTQTRREIFTADTMIQPLRTVVSPDGKRLVTAYNFDHPEQDNFKSLVSIDLGTLARKRVSGDHRVTSSYQWTADGKSIVYGERWNGLTQISRVDLDGKRVRITDDLRNNGDIRLAPDSSQIAYVARDGYGGQQVRLRSLRSNQERVLLDAVNYRDRFTLGSFEIAHWTDRDGLALHGYLFKPPNFDPAKKYPVIVDIHGGGIGSALLLIGPLWITTFRGPLEWHAWAALGYVVLVPEMRSSGEYTEPASIVDTVRDEGGLRGDMQDIASATDWILGQPYIDAKRAALFGLSAGGGRVNKFLTIDHRYAAGIILDPVRSGPLETIIVQALPPYTGVKIGPQPCLDAIAAGRTDFCEPGFLFDGRNSTTPTLIFVGNAEMGAVLGFSMDVLFTTLRKNNVPARMLRYMAEGHGSGSGASAMHKTEEMKKWLETYLKPR